MAKPAPSRGLRDEMNVGPDPRSARQLVRLGDLGKFQIADGEPDVRGWTVFTSAGREVGRVHELLVDTDAGQVVMLDVDLRRDDRHTLVPIRSSWVDQATRRVVVDAAEFTDLDAPAMTTGEVALSGAPPAVADRPDVLQDWHPPAHAATRTPPVADEDVGVRPESPPRRLSDRRAATERVVDSPPAVEDVVVRGRKPGPDDVAGLDRAPDPLDDSLLRGRSDDASSPQP